MSGLVLFLSWTLCATRRESAGGRWRASSSTLCQTTRNPSGLFCRSDCLMEVKKSSEIALAVSAGCAISSLFAFHHVQRRLLQPEQGQLSASRYFLSQLAAVQSLAQSVTAFSGGNGQYGGGYYPQQPQQAYHQGGYPQQGGYAPQPQPQVVYVYVLPSLAQVN